jgi:Mg-chelatase subunit ChlD
LEEAQRSQQVLAAKLVSEGVDASTPKTTMVEIMDDAVPAQAKKTDVWDRIRGKGKFESLARIKVERDRSDISSSVNPTPATGYDPYFIQNEFETIRSDKVLGKVVADLNLQKEWAKGGQTLSTNQAIALLKQKLDLKPVRNTSFIDIEAKSDKPEEAAELANAVAKSYQGYRMEIRKQLSLGGIQALKEQLAEHDEKVREAQKQVDRLRAEAGINEAKAAASQPAANNPVDAAPPKPTVPPPVPQPEMQTRENAFSTFSLNVSDVAFKLAAASLEKGQMPEAASIRSEEFINAFDYRDPEAPAGVPVAFASERARYPYAQNRDLLRFSIKTAAQGRQAGRPLNLVLLLDNSGSMERADRVAIIREALKVLASQLQPQDKLSVITFARTAQLRVDGVPGNQAAQVAEDIGGLTPEGGTNIEEAMNLAYQTALRHYLANGINRVVLLTDGAANLGNVEPESLKQKVEANRKQGIALDCFGIGWEGFNDDLLETLSRNGDGRYGFINSPEEAATEFAGQLAGALNVAVSDVKVQVEFNPARVTTCRQIGYAKHQLTKEQFRDNTVDAAEIAAQEAGNALYVIEVNPSGEGPLGTVRVRFKIPGTSDYREHEWSVPFNGNAVALEQASPAMRLAATASAFSEWLATSPYATEVTPDTLLSYLSGVPEVYGADARPKKLEWMIRQAKSVVGGEIRNSNVETRNSKSEVRSKSE